MLATVDPALLDRVAFPLGGQGKRATRDEAAAAGLAVAERAESQEACFLAGDDYRTFLERQGLARRRARSSTRTASSSGVTTASGGTRPGSAAASARDAGAAVRAAQPTRPPTRSSVGPRSALEVREVERSRSPLPAGRARRGEASLPVRRRAGAASRPRRTGSRSTWSSPRSRSRRARWPCSTTTTRSWEQASSSPRPGRITAMTRSRSPPETPPTGASRSSSSRSASPRRSCSSGSDRRSSGSRRSSGEPSATCCR